MPLQAYTYDRPTQSWLRRGRPPIVVDPGGGEPGEPEPATHDWSESNLPWAYTSTNDWEQRLPEGVPVVDLLPTGSSFWSRLNNTQAAQPDRFICRLPEGVFELDQFRMVGSGNDPTYAFGFFFPKLAGFVGAGPDKTFIQMNANSMNQAQLDRLSEMTMASFAPSQLGFCRIDGTQASPAYIGGVTFRAADQNLLTQVADFSVFLPQPAPHGGLMLYSHSEPLYATLSHVRFQAAGRGMTSQPPFEHANAGSGRGYITWYNCEFDGRRSPEIDPAQPRRCGPVMVNNEYYSNFVDCWMHHSNVSRYACNDQNRETMGEYRLTRCKLEQITNNANSDPAINGGNSLGGYTNASLLGWESCNGTIYVDDCILVQDNSLFVGQIPMHMQLTSVGSRNPQGGRLYVQRTIGINNGFPSVDEFIGFRISQSTYWWQDGFNTTLHVHHPVTNVRLAPHVVTGQWPPTRQSLEAQGVTPATHYLIRST